MTAGKVFYARRGDLAVIRLAGSVRHAMSGGFSALIDRVFTEGGVGEIVIDLDQVEHIDSTNLGLIARIAAELKRRCGRRPVIVSRGDSINDLLDSMGFDSAFDIVHDPLRDDLTFAGVPDAPQDRRAKVRTLLDAHRALIEMDARNEPVFRNVVEALESEAG